MEKRCRVLEEEKKELNSRIIGLEGLISEREREATNWKE